MRAEVGTEKLVQVVQGAAIFKMTLARLPAFSRAVGHYWLNGIVNCGLTVWYISVKW